VRSGPVVVQGMQVLVLGVRRGSVNVRYGILGEKDEFRGTGRTKRGRAERKTGTQRELDHGNLSGIYAEKRREDDK